MADETKRSPNQPFDNPGKEGHETDPQQHHQDLPKRNPTREEQEEEEQKGGQRRAS